MNNVCDLSEKHCKPCEAGVPAMTAAEIKQNLEGLEGWQLEGTIPYIKRRFTFKGFGKTISFGIFCKGIAHFFVAHHTPDIVADDATTVSTVIATIWILWPKHYSISGPAAHGFSG